MQLGSVMGFSSFGQSSRAAACLRLALFTGVLGLCTSQVRAVSATGGSVANYTLGGTNWKAHIFTTTTTNTLATNITFSSGGAVQYLVIGGGGGGAGSGPNAGKGGGGAGGFLIGATSVVASTYSITVGGGGVGGASGAANDYFSNPDELIKLIVAHEAGYACNMNEDPAGAPTSIMEQVKAGSFGFAGDRLKFRDSQAGQPTAGTLKEFQTK